MTIVALACQYVASGSLSSVSAERHPQPVQEVSMATKDRNSKKSMEKKPAQKTLKEKRQAKKNKK